MNEEIFRERAKAAGYSDEEIEKFLASKRPSLKEEIHGGAASVLQGATLGLGGAIDPAMKQAARDFGQRHSILGPVTNVAGSVLSSLAIPGGVAAKAAGRTLLGAGAGAVQGATEDARSLEERAKHAAVGGAIGGAAGYLLPPVVKLGGRVLNVLREPFRDATAHAAETAGAVLPRNAEALLARQEALAPGTTVPAALDPAMPKALRVIGANPQVAREAVEASADRVAKIQAAREAMSPQYQSLLGGKRAPLNLGADRPNIRRVIIDNGMYPGDETVSLEEVKNLRDVLSSKIESLYERSEKGKGGGPLMHKLNEQKKALTQWLHEVAPGVKELDRDYSILSKAKRAEKSIQKNLEGSRGSYVANRMAGMEAGSPAGSIPTTKAGFLHRIFHPDRNELARAANEMLLQPGQIPNDLLKARARAARPGGQYASLLPFLSGAAGGHLPGLLDLPSELQQ